MPSTDKSRLCMVSHLGGAKKMLLLIIPVSKAILSILSVLGMPPRFICSFLLILKCDNQVKHLKKKLLPMIQSGCGNPSSPALEPWMKLLCMVWFVRRIWVGIPEIENNMAAISIYLLGVFIIMCAQHLSGGGGLSRYESCYFPRTDIPCANVIVFFSYLLKTLD